MEKIVVGLTGASGSIYFLRLMDYLSREPRKIHVVASDNGEKVFQYETKRNLKDEVEKWNKKQAEVVLEEDNNLFSPIASGSYQADKMIIIPCTMSTLGELAGGITKSLLTRAADVFIKEKRPLVLVPRETPLSAIHLKNMYELAAIGVHMVPAIPGFYNHPETMDDLIDFVVGKALDGLQLKHDQYERWKGGK
ncbi:MAG TPA: aromatic acid decarboxylase [Eubacteriaceae bacterium]|nr:aromatic acid decarboxylase [Eubacteriaceae bacterium]